MKTIFDPYNLNNITFTYNQAIFISYGVLIIIILIVLYIILVDIVKLQRKIK